jgi:hypothetical protein
MLGQTLSSLTLTKSRMQGKKRQMEYVYHLSYKKILSFLSGQTHKKEKKR